jgi:hypothetical protein
MSPRLSPTYNLRMWCEENDELQEKLLEEWNDPDLDPWQATHGSGQRARRMCRVATETHNLETGVRGEREAAATSAGGVEAPHLEDAGLHPVIR